ncbi:MAG: haloalkane dehalogenase [Rhodospirillales bacterium]
MTATTIRALRTPDDRFANLPDYPWQPLYIDQLSSSPPYAGLRMHYIDEGPRGGPGGGPGGSAQHVALMLHGQPTWSYLYRRMIPKFAAAGYRVVAPDLFGFGRSDKPVDEAVYTFDFHRDSLRLFIEQLGLRNITLVCQDWGGLLGLTLPMDMPDRFEQLLVMNTMLATGDEPLTKGFLDWRAFNASQPDMNVGGLLKRACPQLSDAEAAAYSAPYPDVTYKAGVRRFPNLVPDGPDAAGAALSRRARSWWQEDWRGQSFMAIGMKDPVLATVMPRLRAWIRGCPPPMEVAEGGHFLQEWGGPVADAAIAAFGKGS